MAQDSRSPRPAMKATHPPKPVWLRVVSAAITTLGSPWALLLAVFLILIWLLSGPLLGFSDTWQLIINTITTLITFIMVFIIQNTQNRDSRAIHVKLDDILVALDRADTSLASVEDLPEKEIIKIEEDIRQRALKQAEESRSKKSSND